MLIFEEMNEIFIICMSHRCKQPLHKQQQHQSICPPQGPQGVSQPITRSHYSPFIQPSLQQPIFIFSDRCNQSDASFFATATSSGLQQQLQPFHVIGLIKLKSSSSPLF